MDLDNPNVVPAPTEQVIFQGDVFPPKMGASDPATETAPELAPAPAGQKIVVGDKVFNTTEEALAYANGMAESQARASAALTPREEPAPAPAGKRLGQLIFEDPDQALAAVENNALERFRAEQRVVEENRNFWEDFYLKHSDLKGSELLVDAVLVREQRAGRAQKLTQDQLAPILAAQSRQEVSKIRNVPSGGQPLPSQPAVVAGASGASTQRTRAQSPAVPTNFVAELRGMRKKG
jgi:hypothetical protein